MFDLKDSGARQEFETGARRDLQDGKGRPDLIPTLFLTRLAVVMEKGAKKYGDRNWEQGMPLSRYYASAMRHLVAAFEGQHDEDHLGQAAFNIAAFMWTQDQVGRGFLPGDLNDLPCDPVTMTISRDAMNVPIDDSRWATPSRQDVARAEELIAAYSPTIGVKSEGYNKQHDPKGIDWPYTDIPESEREALSRAGLTEGLDGVWRGATTIHESVRNPGERQTPIFAQPAVFEPKEREDG